MRGSVIVICEILFCILTSAMFLHEIQYALSKNSSCPLSLSLSATYLNSICSRSAVSLSEYCVWIMPSSRSSFRKESKIPAVCSAVLQGVLPGLGARKATQLILLTLNHTLTQQYSNITPWEKKKLLLHVIAVVSPLPSNSLTEAIKLADARSPFAMSTFGIMETASHNNSQR